MELKPEDFTNTNGNFANVTFEIVDGALEIKPIDVTVTITEHSGEADYDGEEHTVTGYDVAISNPLYTEADFTFSGSASVSGTNAGTYAMELTPDNFTNTNPNFANVTFEIVDGVLEIKPIDVTVTITEHSGEADYDGNEHTVTGYDVAISNPLYTEDDFTFSGSASVSGTDAGTYAMELKPEDFTNTNTNFANVSFVIVDGTLVIKTIDVTVTITGNKDSRIFNGAEQKVEGYAVETSNELYTAADFTFSGNAAAVGVNVNTYPMGLAAEQFTNNNANFVVTFEVTDGELEITKLPVTVTITGNKDSRMFSGDEQTVEGYETEISDTLYTEADFTFSGEAIAAGTGAGTYPMGLAVEQFTNNNDNFEITFEVTDGELEITKIPEVHVRIHGHGGTFTYNAASRTVTGYDVEIDQPLYTEEDFLFSGRDTVTERNAGTYNMGLNASDFTNINNNFDTVVFEVTNEDLVILPKAVTVTVADRSKVYGSADPMFTATVDGLEGTDTAIPMIEREAGENAGTYPIQAEMTPDRNYVFTVVPGTLEITPKAVTVTVEDKAKVYGEADPELTAVVTGLVPGDGAELIRFTVEREGGEDAGTYGITATGETLQGNYTVTYVPAAMTIAPEGTVIVRITAKNGTFLYDGTEHDLSGYEVEISNELYSEEAFDFTGSSELKGTNAGTYRTAMTAEDFTNTDPNFENVVFEITNGEMVITKRNVTLTSGNAERPYDGTALRNDNITVGGDGFAENEGLLFNVTGQITNPGSAENTFNWIPAEGTLAENYSFTKTTGTLTVLPGLTHELRVVYVNEEGEELGTFTRSYAPGETYAVVSEHRTGYHADTDRVTGIMGDEDVEVRVTYIRNEYTLTITFPAFGEGKDVQDPIVLRLHAGDPYRVAVPPVQGYKALLDEVTGTMPASDREITVNMISTERYGENSGYEIFEEEPTPLGVSNTALGSGEIIE